jgi:streptomycin 6-kinase
MRSPVTGARGAIELLAHARRAAYPRAMLLPPRLEEAWPHERAWLDVLPQLVVECAAAWGLELEEPLDTPHSLVVPAGDAVLKLNAPSHFEADTEPDALALWGGRGAVRLLARDDERRAFLMERCVPGTRLEDAEVETAAVVADLVPRLQIEVEDPHPFRLLADEAERWGDELPAAYDEAGKPFERDLLDFALDVYRGVDRSARHLVNQDLHDWNILQAEREPWLVIDPKPLVGERELEASGLLRNADSVTRWLDVLADLGLDRERARGWGVAHNLAWSWDEIRRAWLTEHVEGARRILSAR